MENLEKIVMEIIEIADNKNDIHYAQFHKRIELLVHKAYLLGQMNPTDEKPL